MTELDLFAAAVATPDSAARLLRTAANGGFGADRIAADARLNPVRGLGDFKKLVAKVQAKSPPQKDK